MIHRSEFLMGLLGIGLVLGPLLVPGLFRSGVPVTRVWTSCGGIVYSDFVTTNREFVRFTGSNVLSFRSEWGWIGLGATNSVCVTTGRFW